MTETSVSAETQLPTGEPVSVQAGRVHVHIRVDAPEGTRVKVVLEALEAGERAIIHLSTSAEKIAQPLERPSLMEPLGEGAARLREVLIRWTAAGQRALTWETALLGLAVLIYLVTRFVRLPDFPIYFFTDEAVQTTLAQDLIRAGLRGYDRVFLPTYFLNAYQYNLSLSVYLQVLPFLLFGKSIWITRGVSVLITTLGAMWVGLTLKNIFRSPYAWAATLLLSITPAWFLHTRTAFETALATSFYAGFIYYYLRYRTGSARSIYAAVVMAGLTFYSYSPARIVVGLTAALLLISDLKYHWTQRLLLLRAFGLVVVLALPAMRFQIIHPDENLKHLEVLNSYWIQSIPLTAKLGRYLSEYLHGLSPIYWYFPNSTDLARHTMKDYGHLLRATFPLGLFGLAVVIVKFRSAPHRAVLLALLAAPSGAALVALGITRALVMVIPAALITALGLTFILEWLEQRFHLARILLALPVFALLAGFNIYMLNDALVNGPRWFDNYGLNGMQYGASQVTAAIDRYQASHPDVRIFLSPTWANGTDTVVRFFYPEEVPYELGSIQGWIDFQQPLPNNTLFVMTADEFKDIQTNPKFADIRVDQIVPYPNGQPGFYFVHLRYSDNVGAIFAAEREQRRTLQTADVEIYGQPATVKYSYLDMGGIDKLFDGDETSLVRTREANPLRVQVTFAAPQAIRGATVRIGGTATKLSLTLLDENGETLWSGQQSAGENPDPRDLTLDSGNIYAVKSVWIEVLNVNDSEPAHVHVWEVKFLN